MRDAYETPVPVDQFDAAHVAEWGEHSSPKRVEKIARSIASFARNRKASLRSKGMAEDEIAYGDAIADWEEDLAWLKSELFRDEFLWPSTT